VAAVSSRVGDLRPIETDETDGATPGGVMDGKNLPLGGLDEGRR